LWYENKRGISVLDQAEDAPVSDGSVTEPEDDIQKSAQENLKDARKIKREAKKILKDTNDRAEQIILSAMGDCETIRSNAFDEGVEEGKKEIKKEFEEFKKEHDRVFKEFMKELKNKQKNMLNESNKHILDIIIALARKIMFIELNRDSKAIKNMINNAIANVGSEENKKILISAADFERLKSDAEDDFLHVLEKKGIRLIPDPDMDQGGCRADYKNGSINVGIDTQLKRAKYIFEKEIN